MGLIRLVFWGIGGWLMVITAILTYARQQPAQAAYLAFESQREGNLDVFIMRRDGKHLKNLTQNPGYDGAPAWSPDGRWITFTSRRTGNLNIYIMPAFGHLPAHNISHSPYNDKNPSWHGEWIIFESSRERNQDIYKMRIDGSDMQNLTQHRDEELNAAWSPNGEWIAFESNRQNKNDIYLMRADGSGIINITNTLGYDGAPAWSSNGEFIAFATGRNVTPQIYTMRADGSQQTRLTYGLNNAEFPSWSGDWIAFDSSANNNREIFRIRPDGTGLENLTNSPGYDGNAAWSPIIDLVWNSLWNWVSVMILLGGSWLTTKKV